MSTYSMLLFLHVLGGVGVYVALGMEAIALRGLRRAETPGDAGGWLRVLALPGRLGPASMLVAFASGAWMAVTTWGHQPWIVAAFLAMVGMGIMGGGVTGRAIRRLRAALGGEGGARLSSAFSSARAGAALSASLRVRVALGLGILALMTVKPEGAGAALILAAAVAGGVVAAVPRAAPAHGLSDLRALPRRGGDGE